MKSVSTGENGSYREQVGETPLKQIMANQDPKELLLKGMEELGLGDDPSQITVTLSVGGTTQWLRTYGEYFQQKYEDVLGVKIELEQNEWERSSPRSTPVTTRWVTCPGQSTTTIRFPCWKL